MACRLLYLDTYTVADPKRGASSSDAIGYGITASTAIRNGLLALGFDVREPAITAGGGREGRLPWILANYQSVLRALVEDPPDAIFVFHIFTMFPTELRRIALDLGMSIPIIGYTHGSHWDATDTFRFEVYPGMELADLANLDALDRILLVSRYMRGTLRQSIGAFNDDVARRLDAKAAVVGLPLDVERIDACRPADPDPARTTVVFNHAPVSSKNPDLFARVMARVLLRGDVAVLFTREFGPAQPGAAAIAELARRFPEQVILGRDLPLDEYYRALWAADLQVSTATHESLGIATLEAMYTETCCVLPRLGSYPEICDDHPEVLYDLGEEQLEARLRYFLDRPNRRRAVAADLKRLTAGYHPPVVAKRVARAVLDVVPTT
jgi:glycosyltransferase involved in cell wall biosynthesis